MNKIAKKVYKSMCSIVIGIVVCMGVNTYASDPSQILASESLHLHTVFSDSSLRSEISRFIDNVLRQIPSSQFFTVVDPLREKNQLSSDSVWYDFLLRHSSQITPTFGAYAQRTALTHQKEVLSQQIVELLPIRTLNNVVEIGTPATYIGSIKSKVAVTGTIYSINDKKRMTDVVQSFSYNPLKQFVMYDHFVPLNDYAPISEQDIPSNSVDAVICVIGLHHIPQAKIDPFIASIRRILKPNGVFILREHNVTNPNMYSLVYAAHSVFSVIMNQDSLETELAEYRNFQSLDYWIEAVEKHGFSVGKERLLQQGDPTLNSMIRFTKKAVTQADKQDEIVASIKNKPGYARDITQTYLTSPEWFNVDAAQEYGKFIDHTPFFEYPYFQNVTGFWKVFGNSWRQAANKKGHLAVLTSSYTIMNVFVGVMMSVEYGLKGMVALPVKWAYSGQCEERTLKLLVEDSNNEISNFSNDVTIVEQYPETNMMLIEVPRYKQFSALMMKFAHTGINIIEVAGNKEIQVKVRYKNTQTIDVAGAEKLYDWTLPTQKECTYTAIKVSVAQLTEFIQYAQTHAIEILYIHDF